MRHTNLTPEDAALLAGELKKPSWQSRNEGIHERVSFEDTIWGFDLAGGSYYKTPLRVTAVKANSRADKAGIRPGDRLKRINDIDTSTLTIQEAHQIILDSGVHLKIAVTAPEDEEDAYFCYEDPTLQDGYDSDEERRKAEERRKKMQVHARVSHYWSLQWPWVSKRRIIYRESNCFLVPSKFEEKNKSKFPTQPMLRTQEDIVLDSVKSERELKDQKEANTLPKTPIQNGTSALGTSKPNETPVTNGVAPKANESKFDNTPTTNGVAKAAPALNRLLSEVHETDESSHEEDMNSTLDDLTEDISQMDEEMESKDVSHNDISVEESHEESENVEPDSENVENSEIEPVSEDLENSQMEPDSENSENSQIQPDSDNIEKSQEDVSMDAMEESQNDDLINEVLEDESLAKGEEDSIIESILSDGDEQINHSDER
ncbi:PDZ domain (Also known as DHR or GLGF) domain-containing protein [Phthorimaea operculella]|nr:PDZ domain (Also known as DHR or GLGF) domain-containing protein [Phthorimaea operculella]